jgi:hypothetical protein
LENGPPGYFRQAMKNGLEADIPLCGTVLRILCDIQEAGRD